MVPIPPDSASTAPVGPVVSTQSFPLMSAQKAAVAKGGTVTLTATGSSATEATKGLCSGTRTFSDAPATAGDKFLGSPALSSVSVVTTSWTNCTPASSASTSTAYFDSNYIVLGSIPQSGSSITVWQSFTLPSSVKVGSVGIVGTENQYTDSTKTVNTGHRDVSYVIEADSATSVIYNEISKYYNPYTANDAVKDGKLRSVYQYRYRFGATGALSLISVDIQTYITGSTTSSHHYFFKI